MDLVVSNEEIKADLRGLFTSLHHNSIESYDGFRSRLSSIGELRFHRLKAREQCR